MSRLHIALLVLSAVLAAQAKKGNDDDASSSVRVPPAITLSPPRQMIYEPFQPVTLPCEATGFPHPSFEWRKDGGELQITDAYKRISQDKGTLELQSPSKLQEGIYECIARNQHGAAITHQINMSMAIIGSFPTQEEILYTVNPGDQLKMPCQRLKSVPLGQIKWKKVTEMSGDEIVKFQPVFVDKRIKIDQEGALYFSNVQNGDDGLYICSIYNGRLLITKDGSRSRISVNPGSPPRRKPVLRFNSPNPAVGLLGQSYEFQCIFSGNPSPQVRWLRVDSNLPSERYNTDSDEGKMTLSELEFGDAGQYKCRGTSDEGEDFETVGLIIEAAPYFANSSMKPSNTNVTVGDTAVFHCNPEAVPEAKVEWYINTEPIDVERPGYRKSFTNNGRTLMIEDVCKDCPKSEGKDATDLMTIQCKASNTHNYTFTNAYLNVLLPTVITLAPEDKELIYGEPITFECAGTSDASTPVDVIWYRDGYPIEDAPGYVQQLPDGTLLISAENMDDSGASFEGEYRCEVTNGYSSDFASAVLRLPAVAPPVKGASVADWWWIFLIVAIILLLLILLFCCCLCLQRNKGDSYPVDEKERANGNDPEKELEEDGYHDYKRPEDAPMKGSRASLTSTIKLDSDDEGSLNEYGDIDTGKFNEDGSFIGQYMEKDKKRGKDSVV